MNISPEDAVVGFWILAVGAAIFLARLGDAAKRWAERAPRHQHKWAIHSEMVCNPVGKPDKIAGTMFALRCESCGDITQRYVGLR